MFHGGCILCQVRRQAEARRRQEKFFELMDAVWHGDIKRVVEILSSERSLTNYQGFTFHLFHGKSNSILTYAIILNRPTIVQVLLGFGAYQASP